MKEGRSKWPDGFAPENLSEVGEERKKTNVMLVVAKEEIGVSRVIHANRHSTLGKLFRVTAFVFRFIHNVRKKKDGNEMELGGVSVGELKSAEDIWIKDAQKALQEKPVFEKTKVQLGIVSLNEVLVCKGRLENSDLSEESKYPIILPQDNKFTDLVVLDCHEKVHHFKVKGTLSEFRSRFWVTRGRQYVKKVINNCFVCRKLEGKPYASPPTAPLPDFRVTEAPPFSKVGIDFAGPL